jgi:hypothetical protein
MKVESKEIFWLDKFDGMAKSGFFVRNPLFEFIEKCERQGLKVVGIKKPTDWNLEVILEVNDKFEEIYGKVVEDE